MIVHNKSMSIFHFHVRSDFASAENPNQSTSLLCLHCTAANLVHSNSQIHTYTTIWEINGSKQLVLDMVLNKDLELEHLGRHAQIMTWIGRFEPSGGGGTKTLLISVMILALGQGP